MKNIILAFSVLILLGACKTNPNTGSGEGDDLAITSVEGDKVLLRLNPKKGDSQNMIMETSVKSDGAQKVDMNMVMKMKMDVTAVSDSAADYEGKISEVKVDMDMQGLKLGFDSTNPESKNNPMAQAFEPLLKDSFSLQMTNLGKVQNVVMPQMQGAPVSNQMDLSGISVNFPKEAVGVGDSWTNSQNIAQINKSFDYTLTVTKITVDEVYLDIDADLSDLTADENINFDEFTGNYVLDRKTSFTKNGTVTIKMDVPQAGKMFVKTVFKSL